LAHHFRILQTPDLLPQNQINTTHNTNTTNDASMRPTTIPLLLFALLTPLALLSTTWLYLLYPYLHSCAFPDPTAPFRLLALGDPQLEGDSSLPDPHARVFKSLEFFVQYPICLLPAREMGCIEGRCWRRETG
jgi:hypothetical protein